MIWENRLPTVVMLTRCFEGKVSSSYNKLLKMLKSTHDSPQLSYPLWDGYGDLMQTWKYRSPVGFAGAWRTGLQKKENALTKG